MNTYSKVLKYISIKDVKQKHQEKIIEKIHEEVRKKEERQYIQSVMENKKYNWRKEVNEGMTSSGTFFTTLPATGDTNLEFPAWPITGGSGFSVSGGNVTISAPGGGPESINGFVASFDSSIYTTVVFDVIAGGNTVLGVFESDPNPLSVITSSGTYSFASRSLLFLLAPGSDSTQILNLRYQRITPMNVFVSLGSPEATSFIRTDPMMSNLSPAERLKKLQEMMKASDKYVETKLGKNFPGSGAVPPGEYDPFKQAPAGKAGDTPGVQVTDYGTDLTPLSKTPYGTGEVGQIAGSIHTPVGATKFMKDLMKDGFGGNEVRTTVNGLNMIGKPAQIIQQIKLNFPGGV